MKRLISILLGIVMVLSMVFVLAACSKTEESIASTTEASDSEIEYVTESTDGDIPYTEPAASDSEIS